MRIGIDGRDIGRMTDKGGVYRYTMNLVSHLKEVDRDNEYVVFFTENGREHRTACQDVMALLEKKDIQTRYTRIPQNIWMRLHIPVNLFIGNVDVFHGPFDSLPPVMGCRKIVTIHDLRSFDIYPRLDKVVPELSERTSASHDFEMWDGFMSAQKQRLSLAVRDVDHIVAVSHFTKDCLIRFLHADAGKIHVVYNGVSRWFEPKKDPERLRQMMERYGIADEYFLFVGQLDPFKNILRIIDAYHQLKAEDKACRHPFVLITPTKTWNQWFHQMVLRKIKNLSLEKDIVILNNLSDEEMPFLYSGAVSLVFPSLYEGFGMPALEAMACGTPVIASTEGALSEVVGDAALGVDPYSIISIAEGMHQMISDKDLRKELVARGLEHAKRFSWAKTARETLEVYGESHG